MYQVILNSDIKANSFSKTFTEYSRARNYANRLFHKRYTLSIRERGYPADDFIVFNKSAYADKEEIVVYNNQETFSLFIINAADNKPDVEHTEAKPRKTIKIKNKTYTANRAEDFDKKIYSIKDHVDSIHLRQILISNMLEKSPVCQECGEALTSRHNTTIKQIDKRIGFTRNNCFLKHRECRTNDIRTSIQFIYSE